MKNDKWKIAHHKNARSNIGAHKTDVKAKGTSTKKRHRFDCIKFVCHWNQL